MSEIRLTPFDALTDADLEALLQILHQDSEMNIWSGGAGAPDLPLAEFKQVAADWQQSRKGVVYCIWLERPLGVLSISRPDPDQPAHIGYRLAGSEWEHGAGEQALWLALEITRQQGIQQICSVIQNHNPVSLGIWRRLGARTTPDGKQTRVCLDLGKKYNLHAAIAYAQQGRQAEWVQSYLDSGDWANPGMVEGLKLRPRWWRGPLELPLEALQRACGPEPEIEFFVEPEHWRWRTSSIAESLDDPADLPPLIAEYRQGVLSLRDGNHRHEAYRLKGWRSAWVLIWYNSEADFLAHQI